MLCQKCGQRPATVFFSQTVGNETTQAHLCEECAREQGPSFGVWSALNFHPLAALTGLIHQMLPWATRTLQLEGWIRVVLPFPNPRHPTPMSPLWLSAFNFSTEWPPGMHSML